MNSIKESYKKNKKVFILSVLMVGCIVCQLALTFYFTMFEGKEHMGIDSSWTYLKTMISAREGSLYPAELINDTTQPAFERMLLLLPLMKIFNGNVFASYAVANFIITLLCVFFLWRICTNWKFDILSKLIVLNLFICPFLANGYNSNNELGYHECTNGFAAYQNILALALFIIIYFYSIKEDDKSFIIKGIAISIGLFLLDICKGSGLVIWVGVPIIIYIIAQVFIENNYRIFIQKKNLFLIVFVICMILGSMAGKMLGYEYFDNNMNWIDAEYYLKNLGNVIMCFANMFGAIPDRGIVRSPMSFDGMVYCFGIIITLVFYISVIYFIVRIIKRFSTDRDYNILFLLSIIISNIFIFSFLISWGSIETYSVRYLIPPAQAGFILVGYFINDLDEKLILRRLGTVILFVAIVMMELYSDYYLAIYDNDRFMVDEIVEAVNEKENVGLVYFWDEDKAMISTAKNIRVVDFSRVYKAICNGNELQNFGDYSIYDDSSVYKGPIVVITQKDSDIIPTDIKSKFRLYKDIDNFSLYYCEGNPLGGMEFAKQK